MPAAPPLLPLPPAKDPRYLGSPSSGDCQNAAPPRSRKGVDWQREPLNNRVVRRRPSPSSMRVGAREALARPCVAGNERRWKFDGGSRRFRRSPIGTRSLGEMEGWTARDPHFSPRRVMHGSEKRETPFSFLRDLRSTGRQRPALQSFLRFKAFSLPCLRRRKRLSRRGRPASASVERPCPSGRAALVET